MPSYNPDRAEVPLALPGGPTLKLVMDYQAVGALQARYGDRWDDKMAAAIAGYDFETVFSIIEIFAARNHPDVKAAEIMRFGPPWMEIINALNASHHVFMFGRAPAPEKGDEQEGEDSEEAPLANGQAGPKSSERLWDRLTRRVYGPRSSGL